MPLCRRAIEILDAARTLAVGVSPLVFTNAVGKPLYEKRLGRLLWMHEIAAGPHGFRSSFRDWGPDETKYPREVTEAALADVVQNQNEASYRRTDPFERRRRPMEDWANYLNEEPRQAGEPQYALDSR